MITVVTVIVVATAGLFAVGATFGLIEPSADTNLGTIPPVAHVTPRALERIDLYTDSNGNISVHPGIEQIGTNGTAPASSEVYEPGYLDDDRDDDHHHDDEREHRDDHEKDDHHSSSHHDDDHHKDHHHEGGDDDD